MTRLRVAAVLFPDFEMLDLYGPLEMLSFFPDDFEIVSVARSSAPIKASGGPSTVADKSFDDAERYDILLVPGGRGTRTAQNEEPLLSWLATQAETATYVASVCTGSLLLAKAGVLKNRRATTNKLAFDWVVEHTTGVHWQPTARWVQDGIVFTSSGVSAGMDMALALIEECLSSNHAAKAATWAEYIRNPDPENDPFAKP